MEGENLSKLEAFKKENLSKLEQAQKEIPLSSLGISEYSIELLRQWPHYIENAGQLSKLAEADLKNIRNLRQSKIDEIKEKLREVGLHLAGEEPEEE